MIISQFLKLALTLPKEDKVTLLYGRVMTQQQLFLKAIELDPKNRSAYNSLGNTLPKGGSIILLDRTVITKAELLRKS